jgi:hypothetical protein
MTTPILGITELSNGQVDQFATCNEMVRSLESATQDFLGVDLTAANATITAANFKKYFMFRCSGHTVARDFTLQASKRFFCVHNLGTATLSIKLGTTTLTLATTLSGFYYTDGTANGLMKIG